MARRAPRAAARVDGAPPAAHARDVAGDRAVREHELAALCLGGHARSRSRGQPRLLHQSARQRAARRDRARRAPQPRADRGGRARGARRRVHHLGERPAAVDRAHARRYVRAVRLAPQDRASRRACRPRRRDDAARTDRRRVSRLRGAHRHGGALSRVTGDYGAAARGRHRHRGATGPVLVWCTPHSLLDPRSAAVRGADFAAHVWGLVVR